MMEKTVFEKYEKLKHSLRSYKRVGVAFSGGIDSSLLLYAAGETLNRADVIAMHGRSQLNFDRSDVEILYEKCFRTLVNLKIIELDPLSWPEFVNNDSQRCYFCKKKTYTSFLEFLDSQNIEILIDGTNLDDLAESRAGHAVLQQLGVLTPLVNAGLRKKEIRFLAKAFGLPNSAAPSNSCLATRLSFMPKIEADGLQRVKKIETRLLAMGFDGCRAKPFQNGIVIELRQQDYVKITQRYNRLEILEICGVNGFDQVFLNLKGRD
jgi:uncharacterized protein